VVEDSPVNRKVALTMLRNVGYAADVAGDGVEAIDALSREEYDAVLMDIQMPNMDGYETARRIREREKEAPEHGSSRRVPVIAMTASALAGERERVLASGMDDYLPKPFRAADLHDVLSRWTDTRSVTEAPTPVGETTEGTDTAEADVLDEKVFGELRGLDEQLGGDFLATVVAEFRTDAPVRVQEIREAVAAGDSDAVPRTAHLLKGSSASIGAKHLRAVLDELEALAHSGDLQGGAELVEVVAAELARALSALEAARQERGA
jgi:two-component system sensor histidine kinase/response regulator